MEKKHKILIVDDSPTILSILKVMLRGNNFVIETAATGDEALARARENPPDIMLLDIEMPGMDGFETCRRFKIDNTLTKIPILFLSSFDDVRKKVDAFRAGGIDYIGKPVQREELIARLETHLELKRLQERLYREIADSERLIHILCHDVSNPLTTITGWTEMLFEDPLIKEQDRLAYRVNRIRQSCRQAAAIIDHVRKMEKLAQQDKELKLNPVSIKDVVECSLIIFENRLKDKKITFQCIPALEAMTARVMAEKVSFTTNVFDNLFSNTIKFSRPGSVITLTVDETPNKVHLTLRDQGIGIPGNLLKNIFDPGESRSRPGTAGEDGSGFGMPLVKQYMDYYGGEITISSRSEEEYPDRHGTEIRLTLKNAKKKADKKKREVKKS